MRNGKFEKKWRRGQDSNLHDLSVGGFQDRCTTNYATPPRAGFPNYNAAAGTCSTLVRISFRSCFVSLCNLRVLCVSVVDPSGTIRQTTEAQRTQRLHRDHLFQVRGRCARKAPMRSSELPS